MNIQESTTPASISTPQAKPGVTLRAAKVYQLTPKRLVILLLNMFATMAKIGMFSSGKSMSGADQEAYMHRQYQFLVGKWTASKGVVIYGAKEITMFREYFAETMHKMGDDEVCMLLYP